MDPHFYEHLRASIRDIPDFPRKGVLFKDLTTVFKDPELLAGIVQVNKDYYFPKGITKVVGIESRGFIVGGILAAELNAGFVPVRKCGKLPAPSYTAEYDLEYGKDCIQIHRDAIHPEDTVLLHDDLLATGGTMLAALFLLEPFNVKKIYLNFVVELRFLGGKSKFNKELDIFSLVSFD